MAKAKGMFTQITVIKIDDATDAFKMSFFNEVSCIYTERIEGLTEARAVFQTALTELRRDPRSTYSIHWGKHAKNS
jgi:hypothetical protein